jgi:hypothetical protein
MPAKIINLLLLLTAALTVIQPALSTAKPFNNKYITDDDPTLCIADPDPNSAQMLPAGPNIIARLTSPNPSDTNNLPTSPRLKLVVATHGWYEKSAWPENLILAIQTKVDPNQWLCAWYDWRHEAKRINPTDATRYARDTAGPLLAENILQLSRDFQHIHLIGHSAGSWVINEAAQVLAQQTDATLHLTFLDAYVPPFWKQDKLANFTTEPNVTCWAEHYFTRDLTFTTTEKHLTYAHNVDLSDITPGINDHEFPHFWYHATVIGTYDPNQRYKGKKLFHCTPNTEYGFARSLEAGRENFETSAKLKPGNKPVKINKPKQPLDLQLKKLFRKQPK